MKIITKYSFKEHLLFIKSFREVFTKFFFTFCGMLAVVAILSFFYFGAHQLLGEYQECNLLRDKYINEVLASIGIVLLGFSLIVFFIILTIAILGGFFHKWQIQAKVKVSPLFTLIGEAIYYFFATVFALIYSLWTDFYWIRITVRILLGVAIAIACYLIISLLLEKIEC